MHVDHPTEIASQLNEQRKVRPTSAHTYDPAWAQVLQVPESTPDHWTCFMVGMVSRR